MKHILLSGLLLLLCAAATTQPQQDEMIIASGNRKMQRNLAELQRDSSSVHLRLVAEVEKAQRHAEIQQEQARLDLAAKTAVAMSRLAKGSDDKGPEVRKAFTDGLTQAGQAFNQRLAEIDAEQNQSIASAVQRFTQQKAEVRDSYAKDTVAAIARLTQELSAPDLGKMVTSFKVSLPAFAQPAAASADQGELENAYRADADAARKTYAQAINEARTKIVTNIQRALDASPEGADDQQATEIKNAIRRLGLWADDSMDTYQISLKSALRKYQLAEDRPQTETRKQ
jgi:Skp family chaperone for outer membrane proteins